MPIQKQWSIDISATRRLAPGIPGEWSVVVYLVEAPSQGNSIATSPHWRPKRWIAHSLRRFAKAALTAGIPLTVKSTEYPNMSRSAVVISPSPNTLGRSPEAKLVVMTRNAVACDPIQDRAGRFSTELFERCQRSERALAEMYVQRVSTRQVARIENRSGL